MCLPQKRFGNGVSTSYTSLADGSLAEVQNRNSANVQVSRYKYDYDGFGARTSRHDEIGPAATTTFTPPFNQWRFEYDGLNRLTAEYVKHNITGYYNANSATEHQFASNSFDIYGNLTQRSVKPWLNNPAGNTRTATYTSDSAHQMTQVQSSLAGVTVTSSYAYDANGNRVSRSDNGSVAETYVYDALNRMSSFTAAGTAGAAGTTTTYGYDDQGRRVRKGAESYLYDGQDIYATYTASSGWSQPARRTLHGPGVDDPVMIQAGAAKSYLHADGQGSVGTATDAAGAVGWSGFYDAWGGAGVTATAAGATIPVQQYTGRENDGGGLYYYRARYYDPGNGRFTQRDPIGLASGQVNPYAYVGNDPVNLRDPFGDRALTDGEVALLKPVFNNRIDDYTKIDVQYGASALNLFAENFNPIAAIAHAKGHPAITLGNTIYINPDRNANRSDYSTVDPREQALLVHETAHIFQKQTNPNYHELKAGVEGLDGEAAYRFELSPGPGAVGPPKPLELFGYEQQASIIEHYFLGTKGFSSYDLDAYQSTIGSSGLGSLLSGGATGSQSLSTITQLPAGGKSK